MRQNFITCSLIVIDFIHISVKYVCKYFLFHRSEKEYVTTFNDATDHQNEGLFYR